MCRWEINEKKEHKIISRHGNAVEQMAKKKPRKYYIYHDFRKISWNQAFFKMAHVKFLNWNSNPNNSQETQKRTKIRPGNFNLHLFWVDSESEIFFRFWGVHWTPFPLCSAWESLRTEESTLGWDHSFQSNQREICHFRSLQVTNVWKCSPNIDIKHRTFPNIISWPQKSPNIELRTVFDPTLVQSS